MTASNRIGDPILLASPKRARRDMKHVLFVDPDPAVCQLANRALQFMATVDVCSDFGEARRRCLTNPPDLLITNVRLAAHNGIHLVWLLRNEGAATRCVVYGSEVDLPLAREVQDAGEFVVWTPRIGVPIESLIMAELP